MKLCNNVVHSLIDEWSMACTSSYKFIFHWLVMNCISVAYPFLSAASLYAQVKVQTVSLTWLNSNYVVRFPRLYCKQIPKNDFNDKILLISVLINV